MKVTPVNELGKELAKIQQNELEVQAKIMEATASLQVQLKKYQEQNQQVRDALYTAMLENDITAYEDDNILIKLVAPQERVGIDMKKLQVLHPEIVEKFKKITNVKGHVRIKVKE